MKMYVVKQGESLLHIANKKRWSLASLLAANPGIDEQMILMPGAKLRTPEAEIQIAHVEHEPRQEGEHHQSENCTFDYHFSDFFAPYYAFQQRWLEQLHQPLARDSEHAHGGKHDENIDGNHDKNHEEKHRMKEKEHTHTPKKKKRIQQKRRRIIKKWNKKKVAHHDETMREEGCESESQFPWLNL